MTTEREALTDDFDESFKALSGRAPYRWQRRLYRALLAGLPPDALDLPTGLGKTSVMTVWLLARAAGAPVPRRLIYVVDRRAVVDQASAEAEGLRQRLADADERMAALRTALSLAQDGLPVSTLRGQLTDNRAWLQRPEGVAIVVGTVDMIGSRLLFSGYGVSPRMRPVHAALLGSDALVVLDEAHLVPPFEALLRAAADMAASFQRAAPLPVPPLRLMSLSATGRSEQGNRFALLDEDLSDLPVADRLNAGKRLQLHEPVALADLAQALATRALQRGGDGSAVLVFCNSRKVAQDVGRILSAALIKTHDKLGRVEMLVGERRVYERTRLADSKVFARFSPGRHAPDATPTLLGGPVFLVATSAGEVGVDLDADHMVCDLVPWERMVQRLGRVNRRLVAGMALVDVVAAEQKPDKDAEQSVTDLDRLTAPFRSAAWFTDRAGRLDASPGALLALRADLEFSAAADAATSESPLYPALNLAHLQAWAMTSLKQHPGRTIVAPWLRGWVEQQPQCRVVWRTHVPVRNDATGRLDEGRAAVRAAEDFFKLAVPHSSEMLEAPDWRVAEVLQSRAKALQKARAGESDATGQRNAIAVIVLDGDGDMQEMIGIDKLLGLDSKALVRMISERLLIVDARLGGLDADGLLDAKAEGPPHTLDDVGAWTPPLESVGFRVRPATAVDGIGSVSESDTAWRVQATWAAQDDAAQPDLVIEVMRAFRTDEGDPALAKWAQRLGEHQAWAGRHAAVIAEAAGLCEDATRMLILAAEGHDEGKRRIEWQRALGMRVDGGDAWAKSGRRAKADALAPGSSDGRAATALMAGYRHEFGSVRDVLAAADRLPGPDAGGRRDGWRDLCLHLIAAHHGHARPTIPADDPACPPVVSAALAREIALRYARLESRWGPWALAWWESLLRAADWRASAQLNAATSDEVGHG